MLQNILSLKKRKNISRKDIQIFYKYFKFSYIFWKCYASYNTLDYLHLILHTKLNIREKKQQKSTDNNRDIFMSIPYLPLLPLVLWFVHTMSLVSMLATHLTHTLLVFMAKQVQGSVVLRAGPGVHCGKLRVHAALSWPYTR